MVTYYSQDESIYKGSLLKYFLVAHAEFSKNQKNLEDFEILIKELDTEIMVTFVPNFAKGEKLLGGRTSLGQSVTYYISKSDFKITRWNLHR